MGYTWGETQPAGETTKNWTACKSNSDGSYLMAIESNKLYLSSNGGTSWELVDPSGSGKAVGYIAMSSTGEKMMAGSNGYLYVSTNYGEDWTFNEYPWFDNVYAILDDVEISGDGSKFFVGVSITPP